MREVQLDLGRYQPIEKSPGVGRWLYEKPLPLTTPGFLRVMAIGVGSAFSTKNYQSNFLVVKGDTAVFIDLGTLGAMRLSELGISVHQIKHLILTHSHADHIGSVEELALKRRYEAPFIELKKRDGEPFAEYMLRCTEARRAGQFRPRLYVPSFYARELWDMSLRGGLAFSEEVDLRGPEGGMLLEHFFDVVYPKPVDEPGVASWTIDIGGIHFRSFVTKHVPDVATGKTPNMYTIGMVIDDRLYISGDTQFDLTAIERFGTNCESLWHDAQHFPGGVHAFYGDLKTLPPDIKRRMHLYHLSDGMLDLDTPADGFAGLLKQAPVAYEFD